MKAKEKPGRKQLTLDAIALKEARSKVRAMNHKLRQQILMLIHKNKRIDVTSIYKKLLLEQSVASSQLRILREGQFVVTKREGHVIYNSLNYDEIERTRELLKNLSKN